ncbi:MAG: hypothetical protein CW691_07490 [Candidatus Bathyarchaeum sp.]|nr:MAG: hypothetical protein CW691_07490 [Candidatus Bathyarchaeum sp.]
MLSKPKKVTFLLIFSLLVYCLLFTCLNIGLVKANRASIYIKADGSVEGTDNIQRTGNLYRFTGNLANSIVIEKDNIILDGMGYTLQGDGSKEGIILQERNNVTIKNVHVTNFSPCIYINNSSDNKITGNTLTYTLEFSPPWILQIKNFSNNNLISENTIQQELQIDWLTGNAVDIRKSLYTVIVDNNITTNNMGCIGLDNYANHTTISGNTITSTTTGGAVNFWGTNTTFSNNTLIGCTLHIYRSSQNSVADNLVDGKPLVYLDAVTDQLIDDNEAGQIILANCRNITAENIDLSHIATGGIQLLWTNSSKVSNYTGSLYLEGSFNNSIVGCNCVEIELYTSSSNTITGTTVTNSEGLDYSCGITFHSSDYNIITENTITQNRYSGINLWRSNYNNIAYNQITYNAEGIGLQQSSNNTIHRNNIAYNHNSGIFMEGSGYSTIFENNFVDNSRQVTGWDSTNIFDNGSTGNYWSDYNATDANNDNIADSPYPITINSHFTVDSITDYDNFPLMKPTVIPEFPTWIILPLSLMATLFVAILKKQAFNPN